MLLIVYRKSFKISGPSVTKKHLIARDVPKQSISKCSKKSDHLKILIRGPTQKKHYSNAPIVRRTFSQAHNLKKLERAHTGEKLFKCPKCANRNLKEHEGSHSEEKPFRCTKNFSTSIYLKTHERIYSGEIPFKCTKCDRSFSTSSYLETHETIQEGSHSSAQRVIRVLQDQVQGA